MTGASAGLRLALRLAPVILLAGAGQGRAADRRSIAGDYLCKADCHLSDAPPGIEIHGDRATCRNDLGGVFEGRLLTAGSVACFNMTGTLSADGSAIRWSNGGLWERRR